MPSSQKRTRDPVQQVGEVDGGTNTSEGHCRENKRSRMQGEAAVHPSPAPFLPTHHYQRSSQFHSSSDTSQLSTSIGRPSDPTIVENNISLHDIISTLDIISRTTTTNSNPESTFSGPPRPTHMDPPVVVAAGESLIPGASASNEHLGPASMDQMPDTSLPAASCANTELQRQLVQTWDSKRVLELEQQGLVVKRGSYVASEKQNLKEAIENYCVKEGLSSNGLTQLIFNGKKGKGSSFWSEIAFAAPGRTLQSVYRHVQRAYDPQAHQGEWMNAEDTLLQNAVKEFGQGWAKVSGAVGRSEQDCRDRYLNHIASSYVRVDAGKWTQEEQDQLTQAVHEVSVQQGKPIGSGGFWPEVSEAMGGKRSKRQCQEKWEDSLSKTVNNDGQVQRWNKLDAYILVHKVASLDVSDESEIHWNDLKDTAWKAWSGNNLRKRWTSLRETVEDFDDKTHREIVNILTAKHKDRPVMNKPPSSSARHANSPDQSPGAGSPCSSRC